jgi:hypothetical protein
MTFGTLDRRSMMTLAGGIAMVLLLKFVVFRERVAPVVEAQENAPAAERRLERLRQIAATVPGKQEVYKKAAAELAEREKGLIPAETIPQAQVSLLEKVQNIGRANQIDVRGSQDARQKPRNDDYGEVSVTVTFTCGMDQLVNMLTAIGNQPEIMATDEIHVNGGNDKKKNVQVRLSVATPVPRKLLPEKKGVAAF